MAVAAGAVVAASLFIVRSTRDTRPAPETAAPSASPLDSVADALLADRAVDRLQRFRSGDAGARLSLTADEVTAVLRHAMTGVLPEGVTEPRVRLEGGRVVVEARLAADDFVASAPLSSVLGGVSDTIDVELTGHLRTVPGRLVFSIEHARASGIPVPPSAVAAIAAALAEDSDDRVAPVEGQGAALSLPWPEGVALVAVDDRFVLDRAEPIADRAVDGSDNP